MIPYSYLTHSLNHLTDGVSCQVVGQVSEWVDPDSPDPEVRRLSAAALKRELAWAAHLGLQAVLLPPPPRPMKAANYAQVLQQVRSRTARLQWMGGGVGVTFAEEPQGAGSAAVLFSAAYLV